MNPLDVASRAVQVVGLISDVLDIVDKNKDSAKGIKDYIQGKGPRPVLLDKLPDITKNRLEHFRIQALAAGKS